MAPSNLQLTGDLGIALLSGILPSLVWLGFWLLEDRCEPEPKWRIVVTFVCGMAAVWAVVPLEQAVAAVLGGPTTIPTLWVWGFFEEAGKFAAAAMVGLFSRSYDEPLDAVVYMVTAALGFAAMENALFIFTPIAHSTVLSAISEGDVRFFGSTVLHILASGTVGMALAFTFFREKRVQASAAAGALILAATLHGAFNFFILQDNGNFSEPVYSVVWALIIIVLFFIERIKHPARDYC